MFKELVVLLLLFTSGVLMRNGDTNQPLQEQRSPTGEGVSRQEPLVVVSTLDGLVSALDSEGNVAWSVSTAGSMMSSSLNQMHVNHEGRTIQLIPGLDGGLFQFDGEEVTALPVTADTLLASSFSLGNGLTVTGGREKRSYGVNLGNGKLLYDCGMEGCNYYSQEPCKGNDVLVIHRTTQVVRVIDSKTGQERWNYSVGQHELMMFPNEQAAETACVGNIYQWANNQKHKIDYKSVQQLNMETTIKIAVPHGTVMAVNEHGDQETVWNYTFNVPVVNAWILAGKETYPINLFYGENIPITGVGENPFLYLGVHNKQPYIQQSQILQQQVKDAADKYLTLPAANYPRITWKPYLATSSSRTPALTADWDKALQVTSLQVSLPGLPIPDDKSTALVIKDDSGEYPYDNGFYLYIEQHELSIEQATKEQEKLEEFFEEETLDQIIIGSLWFYWKEIAFISLITSLLVNVMLVKFVVRVVKQKLLREIQPNSEEQRLSQSLQDLKVEVCEPTKVIYENVPPTPSDSTKESNEYKSRYMTDFIPIQCLGKGGFGIVFEAKNKIDECHYAIKRICMPNTERARERVMREVKTLAKLDHVGIVRYYNAWQETPPLDWQESHDKELDIKPSTMSLLTSEGEDLMSESIKPGSPLPDVVQVGTNRKNLDMSDISDKALNKNKNILNHIKYGQKNDSSAHLLSESFSDHLGNDNVEVTIDSESEDSNWNQGGMIQSGGTTDESSYIVFQSKTSDNQSKSTFLHTHSEMGDGPRKREGKMSDDKTKSSKKSDQEVKIRIYSEEKQNFKASSNLYLYIQMQLCQKESLSSWLITNNMSRNKLQVLDFFHQIVCAVEYVHSQGLMHRDLKPSNILFSMDGTIKIGDFGLVACTMDLDVVPNGEVEKNGKKSRRHTQIVGTQLYMSPEQVSGKPYNNKVDVFSLGLILLELLVPFGTQMERTKVLLDVRESKFPQDFVCDHPHESELLKQLVCPDPEERPSAGEILQHVVLEDVECTLSQLKRTSRTASQSFSTSSSGSVETDTTSS